MARVIGGLSDCGKIMNDSSKYKSHTSHIVVYHDLITSHKLKIIANNRHAGISQAVVVSGIQRM